MCFSATASFSAGLALLVCGAFALYRAKNINQLKMIAAIPLIFGIQQIAEGFVWLSFINPNLESIRLVASYIFLAFAGIVWPVWLPIAIQRFDSPHKYKQYLFSMMAGCACAVGFITYCLLYPLSITAHCNIIYGIAQETWFSSSFTLLYIVATIQPFFIARNQTLWMIGGLGIISYIATSIFYFEAFTSVWCFFAALITILIYGFVYDESRNPSNTSQASRKASPDTAGRTDI